ncbi:MAG: prepilin-type N-terminal cleavage/methylation domain-containing protein [Desulfobacterales bacterium]|nr:prepilin-type N-terminal cleavage/methylation domain-containing protein [Desulfobacterales bacterium]
MIVKIEQQSGFTIVELMIAVLVSLIALTGIYQAFVSFTNNANVQEQIIEMQQNLRIGMKRMADEIRKAGYDPTLSGNFGITDAQATTITFTGDFEGTENGTIDAGETITYSYDSADLELERAVDNGTPSPIISNVDVVNIVYLDAAGNVTATLSDIRRVQLALVVRTTNPDYSYTDTGTFSNLQGTVILNTASLSGEDLNHRRKAMTLELTLHNLY